MDNMAFCIHGHFYQPPREDPLTGEIPIEPGAAPYRNWNERINAQCYRPNAELGNFERISFNVGPTLMDWMAKYDSDTLKRIVEQERKTGKEPAFAGGRPLERSAFTDRLRHAGLQACFEFGKGRARRPKVDGRAFRSP